MTDDVDVDDEGEGRDEAAGVPASGEVAAGEEAGVLSAAAAFARVAEAACRDGRVDEWENRLLNHLFRRLGLPQEDAAAAVVEARRAVGQATGAAPLEPYPLYRDLLGLAFADGTVDAEEQRVLAALRELLEVSEDDHMAAMTEQGLMGPPGASPAAIADPGPPEEDPAADPGGPGATPPRDAGATPDPVASGRPSEPAFRPAPPAGAPAPGPTVGAPDEPPEEASEIEGEALAAGEARTTHGQVVGGAVTYAFVASLTLGGMWGGGVLPTSNTGLWGLLAGLYLLLWVVLTMVHRADERVGRVSLGTPLGTFSVLPFDLAFLPAGLMLVPLTWAAWVSLAMFVRSTQ